MIKYVVRVYWPQEPAVGARHEFSSLAELHAWLSGVLQGPAYRVTIEKIVVHS